MCNCLESIEHIKFNSTGSFRALTMIQQLTVIEEFHIISLEPNITYKTGIIYSLHFTDDTTGT